MGSSLADVWVTAARSKIARTRCGSGPTHSGSLPAASGVADALLDAGRTAVRQRPMSLRGSRRPHVDLHGARAREAGTAVHSSRSRLAWRGPRRRMSPRACETPDQRLWIAHDGGASTSGRRPRRAASLAIAGKRRAIRTMLCARSGEVWVGTTEGVVRLSDAAIDHLTIADGLADNSVLAIAESRDGAHARRTSNGFSRVRGRDIESFGAQDGLSQSAVYALHEDREGTLWVGTGHGLNQFLDGRTTPYTTSEGLPSNAPARSLQDRDGGIWTGTLDAGLARFDGHRFATLTKRDGLASNSVLALAEEGAGELWVGTDRGLNLRHGGGSRLAHTARGLPANHMQALMRRSRPALMGGHGARRGRLPRRCDRAARRQLWLDRRASAPAPTAPSTSASKDGEPAGVTERRVDETIADDQPAFAARRSPSTATPQGVVWLGTTGDGLLAIDHGEMYAIHRSRRAVRRFDLRHPRRRPRPALDGLRSRASSRSIALSCCDSVRRSRTR